MSRIQARFARANSSDPEAWAVCDRCGFVRNRTDLAWQIEWSGQRLYNIQVLVCKERCYDKPQEQLRTIILPPDPPAVINARVPDFAYQEQTVMVLQFARGIGSTHSQVQGDFNGDFGSDFGPQGEPTALPLGSQLQPPWGSGPELIACDQSGQLAFVLQYLTTAP